MCIRDRQSTGFKGQQCQCLHNLSDRAQWFGSCTRSAHRSTLRYAQCCRQVSNHRVGWFSRSGIRSACRFPRPTCGPHLRTSTAHSRSSNGGFHPGSGWGMDVWAWDDALCAVAVVFALLVHWNLSTCYWLRSPLLADGVGVPSISEMAVSQNARLMYRVGFGMCAALLASKLVMGSLG
eukprot:TRINITY_DN13657_c0_g1_i3.p1 TRINITY_DN13657_c0_g1~~TRINITY_DN13657_c0_g1_i3.p1  ORF type:complete len:179 (-),score=10.31 TRINITY_DN13657_c0_g1_i3:177-713(-)